MVKTFFINKLVYCTVALLLVSCAEKSNLQGYNKKPTLTDSIFFAEHFYPNLKYDPLSLLYCGKSLLMPGQRLSELDTTFSYRGNPEGEHRQNQDAIADYLSLDDNLSVELPINYYGGITGIVFFSADRAKGQIFNVSGYWNIPFGETEQQRNEIKEILYKRLFPVLKDKLEFKPNWTFDYKRNYYTEHFKFTPHELYKGDLWRLEYTVKMDSIK